MTYQYTIQVKRKNGKDYHINVYDYLDTALISLDNYIKQDKHYNRPYYVFNDFYKNVYSEDVATSFYKLLVRPVGDWCSFHNLGHFIEKDVDSDYLI